MTSKDDFKLESVELSLPAWVVRFLDREAKRRGVDRQDLIKVWIVDRIDDLKAKGRVE
jgi:hypothetical protein